jgi:hypothetical protein
VNPRMRHLGLCGLLALMLGACSNGTTTSTTGGSPTSTTSTGGGSSTSGASSTAGSTSTAGSSGTTTSGTGTSTSTTGSGSTGTTTSGTTSSGTTGGIDAGPGARTITVVNQCDQVVTVGVNGGYVMPCDAGVDGGFFCPPGTTCNTIDRVDGGCFWAFPNPLTGSGVLAKGTSATYVLDAPPLRYTVSDGGTVFLKWSGNLYGGTHCTDAGTSCQSGACNGPSGAQTCRDGQGPQGPTTLAEFTLQPTNVDYYDISIINGVNIPIAMAPTAGAPDSGNPYNCGSAGSDVPSAGLTACSWHFDPIIQLVTGPLDAGPLLLAVTVTPGDAGCNTDSDCSGGQRCGHEVMLGTVSVNQRCGAPIGWWSANELCIFTGNSSTMIAPLSCSQSEIDLFGCTGANAMSCYTTGALNNCCGCPQQSCASDGGTAGDGGTCDGGTWVVNGNPLPLAPGAQCQNNNPQWTQIAEPWVAFLKNACPTAYSFAFDDNTSTFTCSTPASPTLSNPNSTGYTITFCPGGKDGTN